MVVETAERLIGLEPRASVIAIDIPIGLPEAGSRECDLQARRVLGTPRQNSVFPAPVREAIRAASREEASAITQAADGRRVAAQAWGIYPKIQEVDELLRSDPVARGRVREVHPELCFWAWNGGKPMVESKKNPEGKRARLRLAEEWLGTGMLKRARGGHLKKDLADDDILDAIAALWSATRIASGEAKTLPNDPPRDRAGLRMEMVF